MSDEEAKKDRSEESFKIEDLIKDANKIANTISNSLDDVKSSEEITRFEKEIEKKLRILVNGEISEAEMLFAIFLEKFFGQYSKYVNTLSEENGDPPPTLNDVDAKIFAGSFITLMSVQGFELKYDSNKWKM